MVEIKFTIPSVVDQVEVPASAYVRSLSNDVLQLRTQRMEKPSKVGSLTMRLDV